MTTASRTEQREIAAGLPLLRLRYQYTQDSRMLEHEELEHRYDWYNKLGCTLPFGTGEGQCNYHARDKQYPPNIAWFVWLIRTGRKWGKTRTAAEYVIDQAQFGNKRWIALVSDTAADCRDIMVEGESGILTISPPWFRPKYEPSKRKLTWPNGAQAHTYSAEDPEQLRGPGHDLAWCDELAKWKHQREAWDNLNFGLTLGVDPHCVITTTPRPTKLIKELSGDKAKVTVSLVRGHTDENIANLAESVVETIIEPYRGTRTGMQELAGDILEDVDGALWSQAEIEEMRVDVAPDLARVVVAVDPSGSDDEGASEQGIVTAGIGQCNCKGTPEMHGFLLADDSGHYTPEGWGLRSIGAADKWEADRIVAEVNYGGAMVESTIRAIDPGASYRSLTASRGKRIRAEPIAALSEQCKIHHVGPASAFRLLEEQLTNWTANEKSPDRLDAYVWAFTDLFKGKRQVRVVA